MTLDASTLLVYSGALFAVLAVVFLVLWLNARRSDATIWWVAPFLLGSLTALTAIEGIPLAEPWRDRLAVWFALLAYGAVWQAIRATCGRPPVRIVALLIATSWVLLSVLPFEPLPGTVIATGFRAAIVALFNGLSAYELHRAKKEGQLAGRTLLRIFVVFTVIAALRVPLAAVLPQPLGAAPPAIWAVACYHLLAVSQALLVGTLAIVMLRDRVAGEDYRMSRLDPLTGVHNRRAFDERSIALARRARRSKAPVSLLLFDIDHFKQINDEHGHDVGDRVLIAIARASEKVLRKGDPLYRLGGEEFACVMHETTAAEARVVADRLREVIPVATANVGGHAVAATVSIGVASSEGGPPDLPALMRRADKALYAAKDGGRNRTMVAPALVRNTAQRA